MILALFGLAAFLLLISRCFPKKISDPNHIEIPPGGFREDIERPLREEFGELNPRLVCPHCRHSGLVRVREIAPGKATNGAALVHRDGSVLMLGYTQPQRFNRFFCQYCRTGWEV